jgi:hypothetical protein
MAEDQHRTVLTTDGAATHQLVAETLLHLLADDSRFRLPSGQRTGVQVQEFRPEQNLSFFTLAPDSVSLGAGRLEQLASEVAWQLRTKVATAKCREVSLTLNDPHDRDEVKQEPTYCLVFAHYGADDAPGTTIVRGGLVGLAVVALLLYLAHFLLSGHGQ